MRRMTVLCLVFSLMAIGGLSAEETVDEIIAKNLEAKGGEEAWLALQTARMTGKMVMGGGAMEAPFSAEFKRPNKVRVEFTMQGMTAVQAYDGEVGWAIMPFLGKDKPEEMAEDQLKDVKEMAEFDGLILNYKEKGHTIELLGTEEMDGTEAYKLQVTKASGDVVTLYLDAEYYVEFKSVEKRDVQGNEMEIATVIGDYKEVGGLMFAHSMEVAMGGTPAAQVITFDKIELGIDLPDDRFTMPEVEEEPASE